MAKYRKKPVVIDAMRYTRVNISRLMDWIETFTNDGKQQISNDSVLEYNPELNEYEVKTLEGNFIMTKGDYLIRGIQGEFYPCKPDIFKATYDLVNE